MGDRCSGIVPGAKTLPITNAAMPMQMSQATGRQRRLGRCPSGKSNGTSVTGNARPRPQIQFPIQAAIRSPHGCRAMNKLAVARA